MPNVVIAVHDSLQRAQRFLDDSAGSFSAAVDLTAARQVLKDLLTTFTEALNDRHMCSVAARDWTEEQHLLNAKLRKEQMRSIAAVAESTLQRVPEFRAFKMPKPGMPAWELISHARAMADAAAIYKDVFFKHGLPSTFLDDFESAVAKFEASVSDREQNLVRLMSAG